MIRFGWHWMFKQDTRTFPTHYRSNASKQALSKNTMSAITSFDEHTTRSQLENEKQHEWNLSAASMRLRNIPLSPLSLIRLRRFLHAIFRDPIGTSVAPTSVEGEQRALR